MRQLEKKPLLLQNCRKKVNAITYLGNQRGGGEGAQKPTSQYVDRVSKSDLPVVEGHLEFKRIVTTDQDQELQ